MAAKPQPRERYEPERAGINAILLGPPGSGKGTQVSTEFQSVAGTTGQAAPLDDANHLLAGSLTLDLWILTL